MLAAHVSANVLLRLFQRVLSIQSTQTSAWIAALAQVYVLRRLSTRVNTRQTGIGKGNAFAKCSLFLESPKTDIMNKTIGTLIKHVIIIAVGVVCYFIYTEFLA